MSTGELLSTESSATAETDAAGTQSLGTEEEFLSTKSSLLLLCKGNATYSGSPLNQQCTARNFKVCCFDDVGKNFQIANHKIIA